MYWSKMSGNKLPFIAEYSKSNRSRCNRCHQIIAKDVLRLGVMVQARNFDGKIPQWYHDDCFFMAPNSVDVEYTRPSSECEIARFQLLRYEDQIQIRDKIASSIVRNETTPFDEATDTAIIHVDEHGCSSSKESKRIEPQGEVIILDDDYVAIKKIDDEATKLHIRCSSSKESKRIEPQGEIIVLEDGQVSKKKINHSSTKLESAQGEIIVLDDDHVPEKNINHSSTKLESAQGEIIVLDDDHVPEKNINHTTTKIKIGCSSSTGLKRNEPQEEIVVLDDDDVPKKKIKIASNDVRKTEEQLIAEQQQAFYRLRDRLNACKVSKSDLTQLLEYNDQVVPRGMDSILDHVCDIMTFGALKRCPLCDARFVFQETGYVCTGNLSQWTKCLNRQTTPARSKTSVMNELKERYTIFREYECVVRNRVIRRTALIARQAISDRTMSDSQSRSPTKGGQHSGSTDRCKSLPSKMKVQMKSGLIVDPDSGLSGEAHVYKKGDIIYNCVLNMVDIQQDRNSFYKLQVLEADEYHKYWLFRAWGRIGTTIGGTKIQDYKSANDAVDEFRKLFCDKTRNEWTRHDSQYKKRSGLFYPIEIDYSEKNAKSLVKDNDIRSKLNPAVQDLVRMLFDVDEMNRVMLEFELDMEKMPLGKLSRRQLQTAMVVLSEIAFLIAGNGPAALFIDASNRFYSLVPHNFGLNPVKVLNTVEQVKEKLVMLENLMQIEFAYSLLHAGEADHKASAKSKSMLDVHYELLNTDIEPMERKSEEFALLQQYVRNTHAATHREYELEIEDIFRIKRNGEHKRYEPFRGLHNRKLLWHGSRLTNFVGILSNGLKIAPPEAPVTGYMFGKGIYFADMVSKSANYCCTNPADPKGLMLLCEVALGDMQEYTQAHDVKTLPTGKHSVKGIGRTQPDPSASHTRPDGVEIPLGNGVTKENSESALLYNEFVVYDVAQVNCQYLLKMKFQYKT